MVSDWRGFFSPWTKNFKGDESTAEHASAIDSSYAYPKLCRSPCLGCAMIKSRKCNSKVYWREESMLCEGRVER